MPKNQKNNIAILFLGGSHFSENSLLTAAVLKKMKLEKYPVVTADKGADFALQSGFTPTVVIGDCDSISSATKTQLEKHGVHFLTFPTKKDETDSELALLHILKQKHKEVICFGLEGDRSDHFLANILVFSKYVQKGLRIQATGENCHYYFFSDQIEISGKVGDTLTLLSLSPQTEGITSTGLEYSLRNLYLEFGTSLGVSNVFTQKHVSLKQRSGVLLAIHSSKI